MPEELTEDRAAEIRDQERRKVQGIIDKLHRERDELQSALRSYETSTSESAVSKENDKLEDTLKRIERVLSKETKEDMPELKEIKDMLAEMRPQNSSDIEELKSKLAELSTSVEEERARNEQMTKELSAKQQKLFISEAIRKHGKPLIEELVQGETEEEILASIEKASQKYEEIISSVSKPEKSVPAKETKSQEDTPAEQKTESETQPAQGENGIPGNPETASQQPYPTGSGPTPTSGPSQTELIEKLQTLSPRERIKFFNENRETLQRIAEQQFRG